MRSQPYATVVVVIVLIAALFPIVRRRDSLDRRFMVLYSATAFGLAAIAVSYFVLFDVRTCASRTQLACMLNGNQGVLELTGIIGALMGLWTGYAIGLSKERAERKERAAKVTAALQAVLDEVHHNLLHVALWDDQGQRKRLPQLTGERIRELCGSEFRNEIPSEILFHADLVIRNLDSIAAVEPELLAMEKSLPLDTRNLRDLGTADASELTLQLQQKLTTVKEENLRGLVHHAVLFIIHVLMNSGDVHAMASELRHPALEKAIADLARMLGAALRFGADVDTIDFRYRSSLAKHEIDYLRTRQVPLVCWIDDSKFERLTTIELLPVFADRARLHKHDV